jgi:hypothetical protein
MDDERFHKLNDEITALSLSHMGDFEEIQRQSLVLFQRYGTTEAEYDKRLKKQLRELRRWRDSGFQDQGKNRKLKAIGVASVILVALIVIIYLVGRGM